MSLPSAPTSSTASTQGKPLIFSCSIVCTSWPVIAEAKSSRDTMAAVSICSMRFVSTSSTAWKSRPAIFARMLALDCNCRSPSAIARSRRLDRMSAAAPTTRKMREAPQSSSREMGRDCGKCRDRCPPRGGAAVSRIRPFSQATI